MTTQERLQAFFEAENARDFEAYRMFLHPDVVWRLFGSETKTMTGGGGVSPRDPAGLSRFRGSVHLREDARLGGRIPHRHPAAQRRRGAVAGRV